MRARTLALAFAVSLAAACGEAPEPPRPRAPATAGAEPDDDGHRTDRVHRRCERDLRRCPSRSTMRRLRGRAARARRERPRDVVARPTGPIWDTRAYAFVNGDAPPSVNPSLWRQAKLNGIHGLFEVTDGVYQVRGYDVSNMTLIGGKTGWIVVDPLTSARDGRGRAGARAQAPRRRRRSSP